MGMLTVRENIEFSAALRLPSGTTAAERTEKVNEVLSDLALSKCANTKVIISYNYIIIMFLGAAICHLMTMFLMLVEYIH